MSVVRKRNLRQALECLKIGIRTVAQLNFDRYDLIEYHAGWRDSMWRKLFWITIFALAMAFMESAVVVYLRGLLEIENGLVKLSVYQSVEVWREFATMVMLLAAGAVTGHTWGERFAYSIYAFGIWDIAYYGWLKVLIDWPSSLLSPDVLFLIPIRWTGPVFAPVMIAALMAFIAAAGLWRKEHGLPIHISLLRVVIIVYGGLLALIVFMWDAIKALAQNRSDWNTLQPGDFEWKLFLLAFSMMSIPAIRMVITIQSKELATYETQA
jgi:hypothetical protein